VDARAVVVIETVNITIGAKVRPGFYSFRSITASGKVENPNVCFGGRPASQLKEDWGR
jgi:hypothetical protein